MNTRNSRFQRGSGAFTCEICGRRTRDTGQGVDDLCEQDYELAGFDNHVNDNGIIPNTPEWTAFITKSYGAQVNDYLAKIAKHGGDVQKTVRANTYLFAEGHGFKIPTSLTAETVTNVAKDMARILDKPAAKAVKSVTKQAKITGALTGVIYCRKARGKKLNFVIGGSTLTEAPNHVRALPGFVYEWHSYDGSAKEVFTPKGLKAFDKTLTAKELVHKIESYGQTLKMHVSVKGGPDYMQVLDVEYHNGALWITVAPEEAA